MSLQEEYVKEICPYCKQTGECNVIQRIDGSVKCCNYSKDKSKFNDKKPIDSWQGEW